MRRGIASIVCLFLVIGDLGGMVWLLNFVLVSVSVLFDLLFELECWNVS